jgi:hypothetical protein
MGVWLASIDWGSFGLGVLAAVIAIGVLCAMVSGRAGEWLATIGEWFI